MRSVGGSSDVDATLALDPKQSQIAQWYAGKRVFITGGTGFMGKVLVEKLLRSCPQVDAIYLLVRPKKGLTPEQRKEQYFKCVIFNGILESQPSLINKVHIVKGDVLEPDLGLSAADRDMLTSCIDAIFHCAANVRFDQKLRPMIAMNVQGTLKVLQLATEVRHLKAFVHVSTSYCQCNESTLEERAYAAPQNPYDIIELVEKLSDSALDETTPILLNGLPNTYAYSKALSEDLIVRYNEQHKLPIIITRPSIVTACCAEPLPGWIEGWNGPTGLMIGAARGVIRSMHCNPDYASTIIPVDKAINAMIYLAYERANDSSAQASPTAFCNLCLSTKTLFSWGESIEIGKKFFYETPLSFSLWYPNGSIKKNYYHHLLCVIFFHYLPAYFIDMLMILLGRKPFLLNVQRKVSTGLKLLQYYTTKEWEFQNEHFQSISERMNETDRKLFSTTCQVNWHEYIRNYIIGTRTYILGESKDTVPHARKVLRRLYLLDRLVCYGFYILIFWFLWTHLDGIVLRGDHLIKASLLKIYGSGNDTSLNH